jgi:phosphoglucomutase
VRDEDAVMSCAYFAEIAAWAKDQGKTLYDILLEIYAQYGFYKEAGISVIKTGKTGTEEIAAMMNHYRSNPPKSINGSPTVKIQDYVNLTATDLKTGKTTPIEQPKSDVLQFYTEDGSKISIRPSGTEPKIKYYVSVKENMPSVSDFDKVNQLIDKRIEQIRKELTR